MLSLLQWLVIFILWFSFDNDDVDNDTAGEMDALDIYGQDWDYGR